MTELSSVSGLRGVLEALEQLREKALHKAYAAYPADSFELGRSAAIGDALKLLAALSLPPSPQPELSAILEHDRTKVAEGVTRIQHTLGNYHWLLEGRGSYEWDDDRYRQEFKTACELLQKDIEPLARIAADWSNCPTKWEDVQAARAGAQGQVQGVQCKAALSEITGWMLNDGITEMEVPAPPADVSSQAGQPVTRMEDGGAIGSHYVAAPSAGSGQELRDPIQELPHHPSDCRDAKGRCILDSASQPIRRAQEGLREEVLALLKRVDEDAKGTRCLTMAEVTLCLNALKRCAALLPPASKPPADVTFEQLMREQYRQKCIDACCKLMGEQDRDFWVTQCSWEEEFKRGDDPADVAQNQYEALT